VVALSEVNDDVFSGGLLGEGVAIRPQEGYCARRLAA
jgi:PTS system beta-glucosides-specific IIC component